MRLSLCKMPTGFDIFDEMFLSCSLKVRYLYMIVPRNLILFVSDTGSVSKGIGGRDTVFRYEKHMNLVSDMFSFNILAMIQLLTLMSSLLMISEII